MKKKLLSMLLALTLAGTLAGCGGGSSESAQSAAPAAQAETAEAAASTDPGTSAEAGADASEASGPVELKLGSVMAWETLTPFRTMRVWNMLYGRMLYDSLAWKTADNVLNPVAAKSWEVEDDGVTWNVEIYDYIHDAAGNHITIDDIIWFMEESRSLAQKPCFSQIESIEKTGDYSMKVVMKQDMYGAFDYVLAHTFVISKAAYEADPDGFVSKVVATGPYDVTEFVSGSRIVLEKKDDYWQKEELIPESMKNNVDKLTMLYIAEASQQQVALETKEVDAFQAITQSLVSAFDPNEYTVSGVPSMAGTMIRFSGSDSRVVANDVNLRKAIAYAIDEEGIVGGVYGGYATLMYGPETDGSDGFQKEWIEEDANYHYDVELAKEYLAKSNYNGETLELLASSSTTNDRLGTMIQSYLAEIGINLKLNIVDRALYTASSNDGSQFDLEITSTGGDLASCWQSSYDITAYPNGDASSRNDTVLNDMIHEYWTNAGFTPEHINEVHDYLMENMYDYGMVQAWQMDIFRNSLGLTKVQPQIGGGVDYIACEYGGR